MDDDEWDEMNKQKKAMQSMVISLKKENMDQFDNVWNALTMLRNDKTDNTKTTYEI